MLHSLHLRRSRIGLLISLDPDLMCHPGHLNESGISMSPSHGRDPVRVFPEEVLIRVPDSPPIAKECPSA